MDVFEIKDLRALFERFAAVFAAEKDALIALDGKVGDSDLGLTMAKGFAAADEAVRASEATTADAMCKQAGAAIAKAAPSTMGTLMATGFLRGGAAVGEAVKLGTSDWAAFWTAFRDGVAHRGKAKVGDKTVLDVLHPVAEKLNADAEAEVQLNVALANAAVVARDALDATKNMVAQHGKAAAFQEKTVGLQDAGSTVAVHLIEAMAHVANETA